MINMTQVQYTTDLSIFKPLKGNRGKQQIHAQHVKFLEQSLTEKNMLQDRHIIVNGNYEIIDGHHRVQAAKNLGIGMYYVVRSDYTYHDAVRLTKGTIQWKNKEYFDCHIINGTPGYREFLEFLQEYDLPLSLVLRLYSNGKSSRKFMQDFKQGCADFEDVYKGVEPYIRYIGEFFKCAKETSFKNKNMGYYEKTPLLIGLKNMLKKEKFVTYWDLFMEEFRREPSVIIKQGDSKYFENAFVTIYNNAFPTKKDAKNRLPLVA